MNNVELIKQQKQDRLGEINYNLKHELMKIIEYRSSTDIDVQFLDDNQAIVHSAYSTFKNGLIRNPLGYHFVYNIGRSQNNMSKKYPKEYQCYSDMCFRLTPDFLEKNPTYIGADICSQWKEDFKNFYEWIVHEENYQMWKNGKHWCLDKDILMKHNKLYSSETCCLVPNNVNTLFVKKDKNRGNYPIGVTKNHNKYMAMISNPLTGNTQCYLGNYDTSEKAFEAYKKAKEDIIKQIAQIEYDKGNITKKCYEAMKNYKVEITD